MLGLSPHRDVTVTTRFGERRLRAAAAGTEIEVADILISVHGEAMCIQHALDRDARAAAGLHGTDAAVSTHLRDMHLYTEAALRAWPAWPMRLGRSVFLHATDTAPTVLDTPAPLPAQLVALRSRHPGKQHFRIALINGVGGNLGDTVLGATAWRSVWPLLRAALGSVAVDALLGPGMPLAVAELLGHEEGIEQVTFTGPTLQQFARYDAFFDFTDLTDLPRFFEMAAVDWVLWWMGLDPVGIPTTAKRNRLWLPDAAWRWARQRLAPLPGPRIVFAWQASVPLRSMPEHSARRFALGLLEVAPTITLLIDRPLGLEHPRLCDLSAEADSAEKMMALTAQADGLISVDSLAQHVADAADVPTLLLLATLPQARYPYYPAMSIVTPAGMESLPGWGMAKVDDEDWPGMRHAYVQAWNTLDPRACWHLLESRLGGRTGDPGRVGIVAPRIPGGRPAWRPGAPFRHDLPRPLNAWMDRQLLDVARQLVLPGQTVVMACGDHDALATSLAAHLGNDGALHVLEPRRLRAQRLAAEALAQGVLGLHLHAYAAATAAGAGTIPDFDPASEADPANWGNTRSPVRVAMAPIDALALDHCRLLMLRPPQDALSALQGARALLTRARPVVLAGPLAPAEAQAVVELLAECQYNVLGARHSPVDGMPVLLLANPQEQPIQAEGFAPIASAVSASAP